MVKRLMKIVLVLSMICGAQGAPHGGWLSGACWLSGAEARAATVQLPATGQIKCYNTAGTEVPCAGTGQDGDRLAGVAWPNPRFTDNGNGTVTDNLTGLIWLKNANCFADQAWQSALDSANRLASGSCGLSDGSAVGGWRLPNINELESLVDEQNRSSALPTGHPFSNVQASYWSSSSRASGKYAAWYLSMVDGGVSYDYMPLSYKYSFHKVWPVRDGHAATVQIPATGQTGCWDIDGADITCSGTGQDGDKLKGAAWPTPRFSDNGDQTLTDNLTGLIWAKNANPAAATKLWQGALDYIASLNSKSYLGYSDWRLPNRKELMSLVNRQQDNSVSWLNAQGFSNVQVNYYWSSSSYSNGTGAAWFLGMSDGYTGHFSKGYLYNVWPVRGGQSSLTISPASKDFGSITTNTTSSGQIFTISNRGTANLVVSSITLTGGDSGMFALATGTCGATPTIAPSGSCTISATFTPTSVGAKSTTLRIASNDPATPNKDVALSGTGVLPTYTIGTSVVGGHGSITCDSPVISGATSRCVISPDAGYHLATFTDNTVNKLASVVASTYSIPAVTADYAIVGTFAIDSYTVTFNSNGGSAVASQHVAYNGTATAPANPTRTGYNFAGWYSNAALKKLFSFSTHITSNTTLYAKWTINLPRTGQTETYGIGDDGALRTGVVWPDPRFKDNGDGTVTDYLTGLIWLKNANCVDTVGGIVKPKGSLTWANALTWSNSLASGKCGLSDGSVAGDWRLPSRRDLYSLVDLQYHGSRPAIPVGHPFGNVQVGYYWSSSSYVLYTNNAWFVNMDGGGVYYSDKSRSSYVWPVRGGR